MRNPSQIIDCYCRIALAVLPTTLIYFSSSELALHMSVAGEVATLPSHV